MKKTLLIIPLLLSVLAVYAYDISPNTDTSYGYWIKVADGLHGIGNFDVAFTFLSIKRERSTIRESKKFPTDKIELIR